MNEISDSIEDQLIETSDGTVTLRDLETGELYHNSAGSFTEAMENYVLPSELSSFPHRELRVLDPFFGLGYNTYSLLETIARKYPELQRVFVTSLDNDVSLLGLHRYVLSQPCFESLGRSELIPSSKLLCEVDIDKYSLGDGSYLVSFALVNNVEVSLRIVISDSRTQLPAMVRAKGSMADSAKGTFDLVFHDPFSPARSPQLWTSDLFGVYRNLLSETGRLLTYSAASAVRGGLIEQGFTIFRTAAVGKKNGGTAALMPGSERYAESVLSDLRIEELEKLATHSGIPYRDPELNRDRLEVIKAREEEQNSWKHSRGEKC